MASSSAESECSSSGYGTGFRTSSGIEKRFEKCPYDSHHLIRRGYMLEHIQKCRHNYKSKMARMGERVIKLCCKYNVSHEILAPELLYHEAHCQDQWRLWSYLLDVDSIDKLKDKKCNLADYPFDPEEMKDMYYGLYLDTMIGESSKPVPIEYVKDPKKYMARKKKEAKEAKMQKKLESTTVKTATENSPGSSKSKSGNEHKGANVGSGPRHRALEDDEDWTKDCKYPPFDYMKNIYNPTRPSLIAKVPPGLNKSERKLYVEWNAEWLRNCADLCIRKKEAEAAKQEETEGAARKEIVAEAKRKKAEAAAKRKETGAAAKGKETEATVKRKERSLSPI